MPRQVKVAESLNITLLREIVSVCNSDTAHLLVIYFERVGNDMEITFFYVEASKGDVLTSWFIALHPVQEIQYYLSIYIKKYKVFIKVFE